MLDNLLEKLRNGDNVGRKARRTRPTAASRPTPPLDLSGASLLAAGAGTGDQTADLARNMLARLQSDGFNATAPTSPTSSTAPPRRPRRRIRGISEDLDGSPLSQISDIPVEGYDSSLNAVVEHTLDADASIPASPAPENPAPEPADGGGEEAHEAADGDQEAQAEAETEPPEPHDT